MTPFWEEAEIKALAFQPDGKLVAAGHGDFDENADFALTRYVGLEPAPDADGDEETDATDRCPSTALAEPVDGDGCSVTQFCARIVPTSRESARACKKADWRNDEPLMKSGEGDCRLDKGGRGPADDRCLAATE